jgi:hypothetical protein
VSTEAECTDVDFLRRALTSAENRAFGGTDAKGKAIKPYSGVAGVQVLKLAVSLRGQLQAAERIAEAAASSLAPEEAREKMAEAAADMPDEDLVVFVKAYCDRHELDWPKRVLVGGQRG